MSKRTRTNEEKNEEEFDDAKRKRQANRQMHPYVHKCCVTICGRDVVSAYCRAVRSDINGKAAHFIAWFTRLAEGLRPLELHQPPSEEQIATFKRLVRDTQRSRTPLYMDRLKRLGLHDKFIEAADCNYTPEEEELFNAWNASLPDAAAHAWKHLTSLKTRKKSFMLLLDHLYRTSGTSDLRVCGRISLEAAANHCHRVQVAAFHHLLAQTGFEHSLGALEESLGDVELLRSKHERLGLPKVPYSFTKYLMLRRVLERDPYLASHMSAENIERSLRGCDAASLCESFGMKPQRGILIQLFHMLTAELEAQGSVGALNKLRANLPYAVTGESLWKRLECVSEWMRQLLAQIEANFEREGTTGVNTRAFRDRARGVIAREVHFLLERLAPAAQGVDESVPLKHFLLTCTPDDITDATLAYMKAGTVRNDLVKSVNSAHAASKRCSDMMRLWTVGLAHLVPSNKANILVASKLLRKVNNERVLPDCQKRRYYEDSEMAAMFDCCSDDAKMTLLLTILKEVGLRNGALNLLQYFSLVDETHEPRNSCNVREKAGSRRVFIVSDNLKAAIRRYYGQLRARLPEDIDLASVYIFNETDPSQPLSNQTLRCWLANLAAAANITHVHVHPHAFRHTLVCNLMGAGNSLEAVSKYMGHKSMSTTSTHYWVATVEDLHKKIINPMSDKFQQKEAEESMKDEEICLLRAKKDLLLSLLANVESILQVHSDGAVQDVVSDINALYPDLAQILENVSKPEL